MKYFMLPRTIFFTLFFTSFLLADPPVDWDSNGDGLFDDIKPKEKKIPDNIQINQSMFSDLLPSEDKYQFKIYENTRVNV